MQNWDHLIHALNHLHLQPKNSHGTDFSRVRTWSLNGWAKYYRQTMIFSSIALPEINAVFNKKCNNYAGKAKVSNPVEFGAIRQVFVQIPHVFHKFEASNVQQLLEARFDFFINKILPQQKDSLMKQTLIYVSSYFDFVRLRNYFKKEELSFVQICEYSKVNIVVGFCKKLCILFFFYRKVKSQERETCFIMVMSISYCTRRDIIFITESE